MSDAPPELYAARRTRALLRRSARRRLVLAASLGGVILLSSCGPRVAAPPQPGEARGSVPDLRGTVVIVLPLQRGGAASLEPDAELRHALRTGAPTARWVFPDEIERLLARSPGLDVDPSALGVAPLLQAEVRRVGDPLYGELRRLGALTGAELALIPLELRLAGDPAEEPDRRGELSVVLLNVRDGRVLWFAILEGDPGSSSPIGALASVAERLARTLSR